MMILIEDESHKAIPIVIVRKITLHTTLNCERQQHSLSSHVPPKPNVCFLDLCILKPLK